MNLERSLLDVLHLHLGLQRDHGPRHPVQSLPGVAGSHLPWERLRTSWADATALDVKLTVDAPDFRT